MGSQMTSIQHITTIEELLRASDLGRCELIRGELVMMTPAGFEHGRIAHRIGVCLDTFVKQRQLGVLTTAEAGFVLARNPDTVRDPDVAFIAKDRVPPSAVPGFFEGPPDLAVEVLSPNDRASDVLAKVHEWLAAGCLAVWVVDPQQKTVAVYDNHGAVALHRPDERLDGGAVLPGFSVDVADLFARP
jgi:Uma2 family endonuclease